MTAFDDTHRPKALDGLAHQEVEGQAVIVNAHGGEILVLNEAGALLWTLLDGEHDVASLRSRLLEEFDVDEAQASADVAEFLGSLKERGALEG
ncbi:MAG: PqqD family protein [Acidobacteriota bacterium]